MNRLFAHRQAQIDHVYTWVCIIELFARSQALFPRSNRFLVSVVEEASTLQTHNTSRLHASAMIRFISLNLSGSESMTPLALRLPLLNYESYRLSEP